MDVKGANRMCCPISMVRRTACGKIVETGGALIGQIKLWSHQKSTPICDHNSFLDFPLLDLGDKVAKVDRGAPSSKLKISPNAMYFRLRPASEMRVEYFLSHARVIST